MNIMQYKTTIASLFGAELEASSSSHHKPYGDIVCSLQHYIQGFGCFEVNQYYDGSIVVFNSLPNGSEESAKKVINFLSHFTEVGYRTR